MLFRNRVNGDVVTAHGPVADHYLTRWDWERVVSEAEAAELKGAELDAALESAGLPKSGLADEKRARLAEHTTEGVAEEPKPDTTPKEI